MQGQTAILAEAIYQLDLKSAEDPLTPTETLSGMIHTRRDPEVMLLLARNPNVDPREIQHLFKGSYPSNLLFSLAWSLVENPSIDLWTLEDPSAASTTERIIETTRAGYLRDKLSVLQQQIFFCRMVRLWFGYIEIWSPPSIRWVQDYTDEMEQEIATNELHGLSDGVPKDVNIIPATDAHRSTLKIKCLEEKREWERRNNVLSLLEKAIRLIHPPVPRSPAIDLRHAALLNGGIGLSQQWPPGEWGQASDVVHVYGADARLIYSRICSTMQEKILNAI